MAARGSGRRPAILAAAVLLGLFIGWRWRQTGLLPTGPARPPAGRVMVPPPGGAGGAGSNPVPGGSLPATAGDREPRVVVPGFGPESPQLAPDDPSRNEPRITLADSLNAPGGTPAGDLRTIQSVLEAWRSNFPQAGNPVGENAEITAALEGNNRLHLVLIPPDNRALNAAGELCDRWGTPILFHQLSGEVMELRSAGPDRKFGTDDDVLLPAP